MAHGPRVNNYIYILVNISECIHVLSEFASMIHFLHLQIHIQRIVHPMFTNPWPCPSYLDSVQILDWYVLQLHCIINVIKKMHFHVLYLFVSIFIMLYLYISTFFFALKFVNISANYMNRSVIISLLNIFQVKSTPLHRVLKPLNYIILKKQR